MNKLSKKVKALILATILIIISTVFIIINGNTYTLKYENLIETIDVEKIIVEIDKENIIKCIDKRFENGVLKVKIKSISEGKTYITVINSEGNFSRLSSVYVHKFGIISYNEYMGDCNGSIIIPISIIIFLTYILFILITSYKQNIKINIYQYKNIAFLGIIVFIGFAIITQIYTLFNYNGVIVFVK